MRLLQILRGIFMAKSKEQETKEEDEFKQMHGVEDEE